MLRVRRLGDGVGIESKRGEAWARGVGQQSGMSLKAKGGRIEPNLDRAR